MNVIEQHVARTDSMIADLDLARLIDIVSPNSKTIDSLQQIELPPASTSRSRPRPADPSAGAHPSAGRPDGGPDGGRPALGSIRRTGD
jgi:hypothetical protein